MYTRMYTQRPRERLPGLSGTACSAECPKHQTHLQPIPSIPVRRYSSIRLTVAKGCLARIGGHPKPKQFRRLVRSFLRNSHSGKNLIVTPGAAQEIERRAAMRSH